MAREGRLVIGPVEQSDDCLRTGRGADLQQDIHARGYELRHQPMLHSEGWTGCMIRGRRFASRLSGLADRVGVQRAGRAVCRREHREACAPQGEAKLPAGRDSCPHHPLRGLSEQHADVLRNDHWPRGNQVISSAADRKRRWAC